MFEITLTRPATLACLAIPATTRSTPGYTGDPALARIPPRRPAPIHGARAAPAGPCCRASPST